MCEYFFQCALIKTVIARFCDEPTSRMQCYTGSQYKINSMLVMC